MKHKSELLKAIAEDKEIQVLVGTQYGIDIWETMPHCAIFSILSGRDKSSLTYWNYSFLEDRLSNAWRIKPESKPDIIRGMHVKANPTLDNSHDDPNLEIVFDGETHKLKSARVL